MSLQLVAVIPEVAVVPQTFVQVEPESSRRSTWYLTVPSPTVDADQLREMVVPATDADGLPGAVSAPTLAFALPDPVARK